LLGNPIGAIPTGGNWHYIETAFATSGSFAFDSLRAAYLARVAEPHREAKYLFQLFDLYINTGLTSLSGYCSRPGLNSFWDFHHFIMIPYLRSLPTDQGGLGMSMHGGQAGAYGCLRSRVLSQSFQDREQSAGLKSLLSNTRDRNRVSLTESKDIRHWNFFSSAATAEQNSWFAIQTLRNSPQAIGVIFPSLRTVVRSKKVPCSFNKVSALEGTVAFSALPNGEALRRQRLLEPITTLHTGVSAFQS
jgi:hypothetical protein